MRIIDADTHVDETEDTWEDMQPETQGHPEAHDGLSAQSRSCPSRPPSRYWMIDGHRRFIRSDESTQTTVQTRELLDVDARVRDMDAMGVETQVIYPTLFLVGVSERADVDVALRRSYNRWLADRSDRSRGRLRWACLPPCSDVEMAIREIRFARARSRRLRGHEEGGQGRL